MLNHGPEAEPAADRRRWFLACKTVELDSGAREVLLEQNVIALFKTADGYFALDGMCAHQGGPIAKGAQDGRCVTCPWHGWQYDITNGKNILTGRQMLTTYSVDVRGDEVWIALPM